MKKVNIYLHFLPGTETVFYVGKGLPGREKDLRGRNRFWLNTVNKYGGFDYVLFMSGLSNDEACIVEKKLISHYGRRVFDGGQLVNLTLGGEGRFGFGLYGSDNGRFGKKVPYHVSVKFGRNMEGKNNPMKGKKHSDESKRLISEKAKKRFRDGFINPMAGAVRPEAAELGRLKSKQVQMLSLDGELLETFDSINEAQRQTGFSLGNISAACNGKLKTYKKRIWRFNVKNIAND